MTLLTYSNVFSCAFRRMLRKFLSLSTHTLQSKWITTKGKKGLKYQALFFSPFLALRCWRDLLRIRSVWQNFFKCRTETIQLSNIQTGLVFHIESMTHFWKNMESMMSDFEKRTEANCIIIESFIISWAVTTLSRKTSTAWKFSKYG